MNKKLLLLYFCLSAGNNFFSQAEMCPKYLTPQIDQYTHIFNEFSFLSSKAYHGLPPGIDDGFSLRHLQDSNGNIYENIEHPLFTSVALQTKTRNSIPQAFLLYLRTIFQRGSDERKLGTYFQINEAKSYITISGKILEEKIKQEYIPQIYQSAFRDYLEKLSVIYKDRLGLSIQKFEKLKNISEQCQNRSQIHFITSTSLFGISSNPNFTPQSFFPKIHQDENSFLKKHLNYDDGYFLKDNPISARFSFSAGAISVRSESQNEKLPLEILHEIELPRPEFNTGQTSSIAEIGRFYTSNPEETLELVKIAAFSLSRGDRKLHHITKIYIEVDQARKRLFQKYGFKIYREIPRSEYYQSGSEYILVADINDFLSHALNE